MAGEMFRVEGDHLVRTVGTGNVPEGCCRRSAFERIAWEIDELLGEVFTVRSLLARFRRALREPMPVSDVSVALSFLEECGLVVNQGGTYRATTDSVHLDGMTEYHALREKGSSDRSGLE